MDRNHSLCVILPSFLIILAVAGTAATLDELVVQASDYFDRGQLDSAQQVAEEGLALVGYDGSPDSTKASLQHVLGITRLYRGEFADAIEHLRRARQLYSNCGGSAATQVAECSYFQGAGHMQLGQFDSAESCYKYALATREKIFGLEHPMVAATLIGYTSLCLYRGEHDRAVDMVSRILKIQEQRTGLTTTQVVKPLMLIAAAKAEVGQFTEARDYYLDALEKLESAPTIDSLTLLSVHTGLGRIQLLLGQAVQAERHYRMALAISERRLGGRHQQVGIIKTDLGRLYTERRQYSEAEQELLEALEILRASTGEHNQFALYALQWLSRIYLELGHYASAQRLARETVASAEVVYGADHYETAQLMNWLADTYVLAGAYPRADSIYSEALGILEAALGEKHPYLIEALNGLGYARTREGAFKAAKRAFGRALKICIAVGGENHPAVASTCELWSELDREQQAVDSALARSGRAVDIRRRQLTLGSSVLSEQRALDYSQLTRRSLDCHLSCWIDARDPTPNQLREVAAAVINTKGLVTDQMLRRASVRNDTSGNPGPYLQDSLRQARYQLAEAFVSFAGESESAIYRTYLDSLSAAIEVMEDRAALSIADPPSWALNNPVSVDDLAGRIGRRETLIEYLRFNYRPVDEEQEAARYLGVVLNNSGVIAISDLGLADTIDAAVTRYGGHMGRLAQAGRVPDENDLEQYRIIGRRLYDLILSPFQHLFEPGKRVYLAPDGALNLVAFGGLPTPEGVYLIERHPIQILSAGRDLLRPVRTATDQSALLVVGNPEFGGESIEPATSNGCLAMDRSMLTPLPGTQIEVDRIVNIWRDRFPDSVEVLVGSAANESTFRRLAPRAGVIHLSTHGYFAPDTCFQTVITPTLVIDEGFHTRNPLLLSGLFLAIGGESAESDHEGKGHDGVLTAEEIMTINLTGTRLVVLSACESGRGAVVSGEGVFGLHRAFQMAGAEAVVSALWKVPDNATARFMGRFYRYLDRPVPEAFRRTCLDLLEDVRQRGQPAHPYLWAGFVAIQSCYNN